MASDLRVDVEPAREIRRADAALRRRAMLLVGSGIAIGVLAILAFERYRLRLGEWLLAEPDEIERRVLGTFLILALALGVPLAAFGTRLWRLGDRVLRTGFFPPPGYRVIHDTQVMHGKAARARGLGLRIVAGGLWVAAVLLSGLLWHAARFFLVTSA